MVKAYFQNKPNCPIYVSKQIQYEANKSCCVSSQSKKSLKFIFIISIISSYNERKIRDKHSK